MTEDTNGGPQGCRRLYSSGPRDPRDVIKGCTRGGKVASSADSVAKGANRPSPTLRFH